MDSDTSPTHHTEQKYLAPFWIMILFFVSIGVLGLQITVVARVPIGLVLDISFSTDDARMMQYLILTLAPFSVMNYVLIYSCRPLLDPRRVRLIFFTIVFSTFLIRAFETGVEEEGLLNKGGIGCVCCIVVLAGHIMYRNSVRLETTVFKDDGRGLLSFHLSFVPKVGISTLISMLYISSDTFGCLSEEENLGANVGNCKDVVNSNNLFLYLLAISAFIKIYVIPHLPKKYDIDEIIRFAFNSREMIQITFYGINR